MPLDFTYVFEPGDDLASRDNFQTLSEAADERIDAAWWNPDLQDRMPAAGDLCLLLAQPLQQTTPPSPPIPNVGRMGDIRHGWGILWNDVAGVASRYVRILDDQGNEFADVRDYTQLTHGAFSTGVTWTIEIDVVPPIELWPPPNGFTRKYPLEISRLDGDGPQESDGERPWAEGDVARFRALLGVYGEETPLEQRVHSGKLFRRDEGEWVEITDGSATEPDVIETRAEFPTPGDYCGAWVPNEVGAASRRLRRTGDGIDWTAPRGEVIEQFSEAQATSNFFGADGTGQYAGMWGTLLDHVGSRWGQNHLPADPASQEWAGSVLLGTLAGTGEQVFEFYRAGALQVGDGVWAAFPRNPSASTAVSDYVLGIGGLFALGRRLSSNHAYPHLFRLGLRDRFKSIEWVVGGYFAEPGDSLYAFDNFGLNVPNDETGRWATSSHQGTDATGPKVGDASHRPTLDAPGMARGFQAWCAAIVNWYVAGGFRHQ